MMKNLHYFSSISFLLIFFILGCSGQIMKQEKTKIDRQHEVAGSFYPADKEALTQMLKGFFDQPSKKISEQPLAIIVPHAGYVFSGGVAASGYKQIDRNREFKRIFIIGSSHTTYFQGASVYDQGDYITPLGKIPVDTLANWLDDHYKIINNSVEPHIKEHSLEVQLPFLQYWLKKPFTIVPIIIGGESKETCRLLSEALAPFFNSDNLFIFSTDFAHYPNYEDARISDKAMTKAVISNSVKTFMETKNSLEGNPMPGLVTAMCGWTSVLTLLDITKNRTDLEFTLIEYKNSGDSDYGDKERVVGYNAIAVTEKESTKKEESFNLTNEEKKTLLSYVRQTIHDYIISGTMPNLDKSMITQNLATPAGAFVTLKEDGKLRGCIGNFQPSQPLYETVQSMAIASATQDYRFNKVTPDELDKIEIEISVLTPMRKINSIDEIELGKDGIYIKKGSHAGTFLPQVATETGWSKEEFLGHCAQDKAFIGWDGWKTADIYVYQALVFSEEEPDLTHKHKK